MDAYVQYEHHNRTVSVREDLKGRHREHCLCYSCSRFDSNGYKCPIAQTVYENCVKFGVVTPMWECPEFSLAPVKED